MDPRGYGRKNKFQSKKGKLIFGEDRKHDIPGRIPKGLIRNKPDNSTPVGRIQKLLEKATQRADSEGRFDASTVEELVAYINTILEEVEVVPDEDSPPGAAAAAAAASAAENQRPKVFGSQELLELGFKTLVTLVLVPRPSS